MTLISAEVGFDIVIGIVLQAMRSASERRLSPSDVSAAVSGILRGLGVAADEADQIVRRFPEPPLSAEIFGSTSDRCSRLTENNIRTKRT